MYRHPILRTLVIGVTILGASALVYGTATLFATSHLSKGRQNAAVLLVLPSSDRVRVDQSVAVDFRADTEQRPINAIAGEVTFPHDKLEVAEMSQSDSIIELWIVEPHEDEDGSIVFSGVLPSPGYTGDRGHLLSVTFKAKAEGSATVNVENAQLLANDGLGTNILDEVRPAVLTLSRNVPATASAFGDLNGDDRVDLSDLSVLFSHWGRSTDSSFDLNSDGKVNITDVSIYFSLLGTL